MTPDQRQGRSKHRPQRTCVACRQVKAKGELVRLVRVASDSVEVDSAGRKPGRGAYLCNTLECWEIGLKRGQVERALRAALSRDSREQLIEQAKAVLQGVK